MDQAKYRMYVDEVGNSDLGSSQDPNHRYLSLSGVIAELAYVADVMYPAVESLKRQYFGSHPDDPVILHRKEIMNKKPPFECLRDPQIERAFNAQLIGLLEGLEFALITVVIDKAEHLQRYRVWRYDPYHYCLTVLVERYVLWLKARGVVGDVMAESRGGREDRRLKDSFERACSRGSDWIHADQFCRYLTSRQLKVRAKSNNVTGLQVADLIAHPSFRATLHRHHSEALPSTFGGQIALVLEACKYNRSPLGVIDGWGRKWLP